MSFLEIYYSKPKGIVFNSNSTQISKIEIEKQKRIQKRQKKFTLLNPIVEILSKIFKGHEIRFERYNRLNYGVIGIILMILEKKYKKDNRLSTECLESYSSKKSLEILKLFIQMISTRTSTKRVEENNKFVYKNTMKNIKIEFYEKRGIPRKKGVEHLFYLYYFNHLSSKRNIALNNFYDPLNRNNRILTLNNRFLTLIFKSKSFKNIFFDFLDFRFKRYYEISIDKKLEKFFKEFKYLINH